MIHVHPADEPTGFHDAVRLPGRRAIAEMVGKAPEVPRIAGRPFAQRTHEVRLAGGTARTLPIVREEDLPASELPSYWTRALEDLMEAYAPANWWPWSAVITKCW